MTGGPAGAGDDAAEAARALGELAGSVDIGTVPYDRLLSGGRRRLRRRRLLTAGAAAVLVAAVVGGGAVLGERGRQAVSSVAVAASASGSAPASAAATPTEPARDPFTPIRVKVGEGTANGHTWQAWAALWPAAPTKEDAYRQEELRWEDRHTAIPQLPKMTNGEVDRHWRADLDEVNLYLTLDGRRQVDDTVHQTVVPAKPGAGAAAGSVPASAFSGGGAMLGAKGGELGASPVVVAGVTPEVAKVVVTWQTGGSTEAVPVAVGDSTTRWVAIPKKPGSDAKTFTLYAADGTVLGTDDNWFRTS
ncbi:MULTISPECIES: hypothetical protein [unclassified Kitasatospora]|uniref:hypothetical protein n=1 Tax=unclassified Kitasatospora TaxID=2633591 RepID=UPI0033DCF61E